LAPVLIVEPLADSLWNHTVPDPGVDVTSLKPQTRRIFKPALCTSLSALSTSALFVRNPIQYEFVPAKYPVLPSILNYISTSDIFQ
jgi:hypothetical protein